jgi:hypothetical protein
MTLREFCEVKSLKLQRRINVLAATAVAVILAFLSAALSAWGGELSVIEYPSQELGQAVIYPQDFWPRGIALFFSVAISGSVLAFAVRNAVVTVDGYDKPKGSIRLQIWGYSITGFGVSCSSLIPLFGPLIFIIGLACLVVSIHQKPASWDSN